VASSNFANLFTPNGGTIKTMAKKKVSAKAPKKAAKAAKAKPTAKAKKASPVKAKAKPAAKKVKAATPKKAAPKAAPKKEIAKKVVVAKKPAPPTPLKKTAKGPVATKEAPKAPPATSAAAKVAAAAQLNFFQMPNQRPMAHKPAKSAQSEDKTRYSEDELKEFQSLIIKKLDKAKEEYKILKETLNRNNDEGTDATSGGNTKVLEDGAETAEKENLSQLAARQQKYIMNLENALVRIKNGTYGICSVTGKLISKERLIAVPHTTQSIEAKLMQQD
jgi:RNA polymerase-binding transcription factor DksA